MSELSDIVNETKNVPATKNTGTGLYDMLVGGMLRGLYAPFLIPTVLNNIYNDIRTCTSGEDAHCRMMKALNTVFTGAMTHIAITGCIKDENTLAIYYGTLAATNTADYLYRRHKRNYSKTK